MTNALELNAPNTVELNLSEMEQTNGGDTGDAAYAIGYGIGKICSALRWLGEHMTAENIY